MCYNKIYGFGYVEQFTVLCCMVNFYCFSIARKLVGKISMTSENFLGNKKIIKIGKLLRDPSGYWERSP